VAVFGGRGRSWTRLAIARSERPFVAAMFGYFFLVIATFWVLKPLKKGLLISFYQSGGIVLGPLTLSAAQGELVAKIVNVAIALLATAAFTQLARSLRRQQLTYVFTAFSCAGFLLFAQLMQHPGAATVWTFYLFGDLFSTLMVATFFAFLNDSVLPDESERLYGPIVVGGAAGGVAGSSVVAGWIGSLSIPAWLWLCTGLGLATALLAAIAGRIADRRTLPDPPRPAPVPAITPAQTFGARLVLRSPYLLAILVVVGCHEIACTLLEFMTTTVATDHFSGPAIGAYFARVFSAMNWAALGVQLVLTSALLGRFGVGTTLAVQPAAMTLASMAFLAAPTPWMGGVLNTTGGAFGYTLHQSAKEALYTSTSRTERYGAKAFIDMFGQRAAKGVALLATLAITTLFADRAILHWLAFALAALGAIWLGAVRYAGREFDRRAAG
jgi:AAA family ATP:ADP antiporter